MESNKILIGLIESWFASYQNEVVDEPKIIELLVAGNKSRKIATSALRFYYADRLFRLCVSLLGGDEVLADEVALDTLEALIRGLHEYPQEENFSLYSQIQIIALKKCEEHLHERKMTQIADMSALSKQEIDKYAELRQYLHQVSDTNRIVLAMFWDGVSYPKIAEWLGITPVAARRRGSRGNQEILDLKKKNERSAHG
jgi:DNA-directed RNA polymerase specialized sigma24 family protein